MKAVRGREAPGRALRAVEVANALATVATTGRGVAALVVWSAWGGFSIVEDETCYLSYSRRSSPDQ